MANVNAFEDCPPDCGAIEKRSSDPVCLVARYELTVYFRDITRQEALNNGIQVNKIPDTCQFCRLKERY